MAGTPNLTREEARERAALLAVDSYDVELDLTGAASSAATFRSRCRISFSCTVPGSTTFVDLVSADVRTVSLNGRELDPGVVSDGTRIHLSDLATDNELMIDADCLFMRTGEGLHRFVDPVDETTYLYTQFETFDAHRMFACFDQPDLKARFTFEVTVPASAGWVVVSNMPGHLNGPVWSFDPTPRQSSYITALVAGPYHAVHDVHDGIPLGLYCRRSLAEFLDIDELFTVTRQGFDFFHSLFGYRYPWPKYDQLFVPEFNAGAMENAGCVTFLEDYVFRSKVTDANYERRAETILHEMAHMWFGDLVTMRWWDDLWLNESFASYAAVLAQVESTRHRSGWTTFASVEKTWAYRQDQLPSTHPIAADIPDIEAVQVNFDGITYAKGASVLKQLVAWVGRDAFFTGLRSYFTRHAYANTTLADLLEALEHSSGRDLSAWCHEWLETAGVNTLRVHAETDDSGHYASATVQQEATTEHSTLRSHRVAVGLYDLVGARLIRRKRVELDIVGAKTEVPDLVGEPRADVLLVNDDDLTYAKIRLDKHSLDTVTSHIGAFAESLPRALCWTAAWDMTRDAEMPTRDYLTLVLGGIGAETDIGVVQSLLRQTRSALDTFADPAFRPVGLRRLAEAAEAHMRAAAPGSDHQLAWVRAFSSAATDPEHVAAVQNLLSGEHTLAGLSVDTELRWHLLHRLAALGVASSADIDAELERDRTAAGERHAAAARAAQPDRAAKAAAWRVAVEDETTPNAVQTAVIGGFVQASQRDLLRDYVEPYFAVVADVYARRTSEMAQNIVVGLYPFLLIEPATVERTDAYLRAASPPPALARLLLEGRDGVARALRAQARDAAAD